MKFNKLIPFACLIFLLASCTSNIPEEIQEVYNDLPEELDFNIHVKPVLSDKCFACHGPDKGKIKAGLQLHSSETAYAELPETPGKYAIVPGDLSKSEAFHRIMSHDPEYMMPTPEFKVELSDREKAILVRWIDEGAEYQPHWAFEKPKEQKVPKARNQDWVKNPIDNFVGKVLESNNLMPMQEAEKSLLLRRLSLDLTGLPPTVEELKNFLNDDSEGAYEKQVDRLIASSHYGEKMATDWMDVARYADTHGYQVDRYRDMSPWREWVIETFNKNMPYDEFITWQIAGDLMPNPTTEQILATGFNRLHAQNMEGGIVDEEFRVEYVADRTSVVGQGIMALTMGCARCHDHKYDPISQKEFYEFYSFFNNVNETGQISWDPGDIPVPTLLLPTEKQKEVLAYLEEQMDEKEKSKEELIAGNKEQALKWIQSGAYRKNKLNTLSKARAAKYTFNGTLKNNLDGKAGKMDRKFSSNEKPVFVNGYKGKSLKIDGDAWLDLKPVGTYKRNQAFSIGLWVNIPDSLKEGVIFHKNKGSRLHSYKGYHLYYKDKKLEMLLAHTWPDNSIEKHSVAEIPTNEWAQITMTYDGSSKADGLKIYVNGKEIQMEVKNDNLYKDIIFDNYEDVIYAKPIEPGLKIGGRWRGFGIKDAMVDDLVVYSRELTSIEVMQLGNAMGASEILAKAPSDLSSEENEMLSEYFITHKVPGYQKTLSDLAKIRGTYVDSMEVIKEVMVMKDMPERRKSYLLERGLYDGYGEEVFPNTPSTILPMPDDLPKNRLGLAKWLTHPDHPLTARVAVNRYWQNYFGRGIVKTSEDFGNQGELPSHPKLLDWLALDFMNSGWDVKALQKKIVMSATYRQSSLTSPELREMDSENVLLARGPNMRLTSEMIRDNALAASELINKEVGGESVRPYQPPGLWKMNADTYIQDTGDKLYRRSLYSIWKRSVPLPTQSTFDQPERSDCTVRRQKTNTPLQALVLLNDPTFVEASRKIGETITKASNIEEGIADAFIKLTGREPGQKELAILTEMQQKEYEKFASDSSKAKGWLETGAYRIDQSLDSNLVAANAVVASVILNTDATITKR
ncbi:MAG: DUF1553 domain-containing protein [Cyclobacteriaceae bacterium]